jgi:glycosyltransferase involved in cell wall biosynthesis
MKYCFVVPSQCVSPKGGVKVQAEMWKAGLQKQGHSVMMAGSWDTPDWSSFDAIIIFGYAPGVASLAESLFKENPRLVMAPIIDPPWVRFVYKFFVKYWGAKKFLGLSSRFHDLWLARKFPCLWLVRSEEERRMVNYALEIPQEKIVKIPLHYRIPPLDEFPQKEDFCIHVSRLKSANKNVPRMIEAAKKYGFDLKLVGHLMGESEKNWLYGLIGDAKNIEYVGEISEADLLEYYKRAKVIALPSMCEGVGMVALEGAAYGCEVVLTNIGAPKEYYEGRAILVNPRSVDEIGQGISKAIREGFSQPELKIYIENHYSEAALMRELNEKIATAIGKQSIGKQSI